MNTIQPFDHTLNIMHRIYAQEAALVTRVREVVSDKHEGWFPPITYTKDGIVHWLDHPMQIGTAIDVKV